MRAGLALCMGNASISVKAARRLPKRPGPRRRSCAGEGTAWARARRPPGLRAVGIADEITRQRSTEHLGGDAWRAPRRFRPLRGRPATAGPRGVADVLSALRSRPPRVTGTSPRRTEARRPRGPATATASVAGPPWVVGGEVAEREEELQLLLQPDAVVDAPPGLVEVLVGHS
jgi:hypothetical protein